MENLGSVSKEKPQDFGDLGSFGPTSIEIIPRRKISKGDWDRVVKESPDGWVFGLFEWQELILGVREWNLTDESFGLLLKGEYVGVVPLQFNPESRITGSSGWGGTGPILCGKLSQEGRANIMRQALSQCLKIAKKMAPRN